jgi:cytochrome c
MTKTAVIPGRRGAAFAFAVVMAARPSVAADAVRGQQLYVECIACHSLAPGIHGIGPSLHGVFNRQAGVLEGFRYSPALRRSGIIWTADTLDAFIAFPEILARKPHAFRGHA